MSGTERAKDDLKRKLVQRLMDVPIVPRSPLHDFSMRVFDISSLQPMFSQQMPQAEIPHRILSRIQESSFAVQPHQKPTVLRLQLRDACMPLVFGMAYLFAAELGHFLSFEGAFASFWPPSGVYLSALLLTPGRRWSVFMATALFANVASDTIFHDKSLAMSLGFWAANSLEAVSTAAFLRMAVGPAFSISTLKSVLWLVSGTALCGSVIGASVGACVVTAALGADFWSSWLVWWISGLIGSVLLVPGVLNAARLKPWRDPAFVHRMIEALGVVVATSAVSYFVFGCQTRALSFTTLPPLLWAAVRLQVCGAVLSGCALSVTCVWHTAHGHGPFAFCQSIPERVLLTQCFLVVSTLVPLLLGAVMTESKSLFSALENHRRRLELLASTDALTGVANRGAFQTKLKAEWENLLADPHPLSLLLIDVDHFKSFNDTFGHSVGDDILRSVGMILRQSVRSSDFVARYGGEEFAVLLPETEESEAVALAERIRRSVEATDWKQRHVTISVGVTTAQIGIIDSLDVINAADRALYTSKGSGRNRVSFTPVERHSIRSVGVRPTRSASQQANPLTIGAT